MESPSDILEKGDRVYCKVISIGDDGKIGLSMKYVNQGNGSDLDPNNVLLKVDEQRKKSMPPGSNKNVIKLEAIVNNLCNKCNTIGHLAIDCHFTPGGKKYDLIPSEEDEPPPVEEKAVEISSKKSKKPKKRKQHSSDGNESSSEERHKRRKKSKKEKKKKKKKSRKSSDSDSDHKNRSKTGRN